MNSIMSVIIDSREPQWVQQLTFGGAPTAVTALEAGDFLVATSDSRLLGIERKTSDDLLNTLRGDRLFPQIARLRQTTEWAYLLITGPLLSSTEGKVITNRVTGWDWNSVQGALLTVQELGVQVVLARGDDDLEAALMRLAARRREDARILPPRQPHIMGPGEAAIAALPGIGLERLNAVLEATGAPIWALVALTDPAPEEHIPGIGAGTRQTIRRALGMPKDCELLLVPRGAVAREVTNATSNH